MGHLLVAIVVEFVVAAESKHGADTHSVREKHLGGGVNPHLKNKELK